MAFTDRLHNRGSISTGYDIDNSLKLEDDNSEGLTKNYSGDGDRRTWTYSTWIKRTELSQDYYCLFFAGYTGIQLMSENYLRVELYDGTTTRYADTNQLFRDTSAWYHIVVTLDSTDSTASDRVKIWINGSRVTDFRTSTYASMSQNDQFGIGQASSNYQFGHWFAGGANDRRFCGYVAETHYVNGTALEATDFGEYDSDSGIWIPKEYTGSHGSKGFYLKFDDSSNLGKDSSSGGIGDFTLSNITSADQATDTPTNNFCTLNPLDNNWANVPIINEGATNHHSDSANFEGSSGTIAMSSGKWYWEIKTMHSDGNVYMLGIGSTQYGEAPGTQSPHDVLNFAGLYLANSGTEGGLFVTDSTGGSVYRNAFNPGANYSAGDIYGFALDLDSSTQTITFYRNGSNINPSSGAALDIAGACSILPVTVRLSIYEREAQCNFGGYTEFSISSAASDENGYGTFEYAPPTGYYAICTKNLAEYG
jgi:hypothetical protein